MTYKGEKLFFREGCSQCHTFQGKGGRMGPDLSAVTNIRSDSWIDSYLQDPKAFREANPDFEDRRDRSSDEMEMPAMHLRLTRVTGEPGG